MRLFAVVLAALAATGATTKPPAQLLVTALDTRPGVVAETDVDLILANPAGSVSILVPPGYGIDVGARPGTVIGTARTAVASSLVAAGPGSWRATGVSVAVERSDDGRYRLTCNLARPAGELDLDLQGLTNPPGGIVTWRAVLGAGPEARSIVAFPQRLSLTAALARGTLRATGRLLFAGKPRAGVNVHLAVATREDFRDARELGTVRTDAGGRFRLTTRLARRELRLIAYVNFYVAGNESISPPPPQVVAIGPG
jgi:hypothetical protein